MRAEESRAAGYQCSHSCSPGSAAVFAGDRENGFDYVGDFFVGHRGVDRKRQAAAEDVFGDRKIAVVVAVVALIVVHRVQRDAVHGASHATLPQYLDELIAAELEALGPDAQHVEMPGVLEPRLGVGGLQRVVGAKRLVVGAGDLAAPAHEVSRALDLGQSDGGVHVRQVVLETHVVDFVVPRAALVVALPRVLVHSVQAGDGDFFSQRVVGGGDYAALGGGEILGGVETETGEVADGADFRHPAPVHVARGAGRVRGILDNFQIVVARDFEDPIHVASLAGKVHGQDRADPFVGATLERLLDAGRVDVEGAGIDVNEHRPRPEVAENLGGRSEGKRRGDNLVAGTDAERP